MRFILNGYLSAFYILFIIISIVIIILERRRPEKTIAWLLLFLLFPPLGIFLYLFLGRNWKVNILNHEPNKELRELLYNAMFEAKVPEYKSLFQLIANNSDSPLFIDNEVTVFRNGEEKFRELKKQLNQAKHHIHLEYYIVNSDGIGEEITEILIKKSLEGVKVRFILDKVGSVRYKNRDVARLKSAGVDVLYYSYFLAPVLRFINTQINYRNHRKIVVIDGSIGFIGGINIGDEYLGKTKFGYWRDTHLMVKGDFVLGLQSVFLDDYLSIKEVNNEMPIYEDDFSTYFPKPVASKGQTLQLVKSGPNSAYPSILQATIKMINMAEDHIYITTPYFVPPDSIMEALRIASLGGIEVSVLFPEQSDHIPVHLASRTYLNELIKCGIKVYLYDKNSFIHSKVITVDGLIGTVGTANMDIRSYEQNYEINAVIYSSEVVKRLENDFLEDLKKSTLTTYDGCKNEPFYIKWLEAIARVFSYLL
jgi:cardiolipin synthase A/B